MYRNTPRCCWYHKGTNFQANHNTKVKRMYYIMLLLIPQRYEFSSKSQPYFTAAVASAGCCWYHKGTNFQANHNSTTTLQSNVVLLLIPQRYEFSSKSQHYNRQKELMRVVADTTKVRIFKQITTILTEELSSSELLLIPQRYEFSSKSQRVRVSYI